MKPADLPKSYEDFLTHKEWAGKIAIDQTDTQWLKAIVTHYGEQKGRKLVEDIVATLNPILVDGHLALARSVAAGEYPVALNNYMNLTINQMLSGGPTDYWALDPVAVFFGSVGGEHAGAASEGGAAGGELRAHQGGAVDAAEGRPAAGAHRRHAQSARRNEAARGRKVIVAEFPGEEEKKWQREFQEIFRRR